MIQKKITAFTLCILFVLGLFNLCSAQYAVGDTVTSFSLKDMNNNTVTLNQFNGKIVLLNFFTSW